MTKTSRPTDDAHSSVRPHALHHIEIWVGNAVQSAHYFRTAFGFRPTGYAGLETGARDRMSVIMEQGDIRLILTSGLAPESPIAEYVHLHGDSVRDVAFSVEDSAAAFATASEFGATAVREPHSFETDYGPVVTSTIKAFGDTVHSFVQRPPEAPLIPHLRPIESPPPVPRMGLTAVDHVAVGLPQGGLDELVQFYTDVLGFRLSHEEMVWTGKSGMNSKVVEDTDGLVKVPIVESMPSDRPSQIDEYLMFHKGGGTQHLAFETEDIVDTVRRVRGNGVEMLRVPNTYYTALQDRVGALDPEFFESVRQLGVLVDSDRSGRLYQTFTKPIHSRPTLFIELIERDGATGFGGGNIKALFEAVEREQEQRGNL